MFFDLRILTNHVFADPFAKQKNSPIVGVPVVCLSRRVTTVYCPRQHEIQERLARIQEASNASYGHEDEDIYTASWEKTV